MSALIRGLGVDEILSEVNSAGLSDIYESDVRTLVSAVAACRRADFTEGRVLLEEVTQRSQGSSQHAAAFLLMLFSRRMRAEKDPPLIPVLDVTLETYRTSEERNPKFAQFALAALLNALYELNQLAMYSYEERIHFVGREQAARYVTSQLIIHAVECRQEVIVDFLVSARIALRHSADDLAAVETASEKYGIKLRPLDT